MKVAFIVSRLTNGGTEKSSVNVASLMALHDIEIYIIVRENDTPLDYSVPSAVNLVFLDSRSKPSLADKIKRLGDLSRVLKEISPDWVVSFNHGYANMLLSGVFFRYKTITSERFYAPAHYKGMPISKTVSWLAYFLSTKVVFQTEECRDAYGKMLRQKSYVIPNAVEGDFPHYEWSSTKRDVVCVSRFAPQKNIPLLLGAFSRFHKTHPDYKLVIFGGGAERDNVVELVERMGLESCVSINSFVSDVHDRIIGASMFVSSSDYEGIQNSLLEAMAMGIPCVATDCFGGGAKLLMGVDNNRGILVPRGDEDALYEAMSKIADDALLAQSLSIGARTVREDFSPEKVGELWLSLL